MNRVFLDANILFSAAYGSPKIRILWLLARSGHHELIASHHVIEEARRNLMPEQRRGLEAFVHDLTLVPTPSPAMGCPIDLPPGDREAFMAAVSANATHFLTGDLRHFGPYLGKRVMGILIQRPADYVAKRKESG